MTSYRVLQPQKKSALYPNGFGAVLSLDHKLEAAAQVVQTIERESDLLKLHGIVLLARENVHEEVGEEIATSSLFRRAFPGFASKLIHAHSGDNHLYSPKESKTGSIFTNRDTLRAQLQLFANNPQARVAASRHQSIGDIVRALSDGTSPISPLQSVLQREYPDKELDTFINAVHVEEAYSADYKTLSRELGSVEQGIQHELSDQLIPVDWVEFFGGKFAAHLPHGQDVRTNIFREEALFTTNKDYSLKILKGEPTVIQPAPSIRTPSGRREVDLITESIRRSLGLQ